MPGRLIIAVALCLTVALSGCVIIPYKPAAETHYDLSAIANPQRIRLNVGPRQFLGNMAKGALQADKRLQQVDGQAFLDAASPEQELTLARLLEPSTRALIEPMQVDYLVLLGRPEDKTLESKGGVIPYLGFFGLGKSRSSTTYWAAVVDVRQLQLVGQFTSMAVGTDAGIGLFYGLFVVSDTSGSAREDALRHVVAAIAGAKPSGPLRVAFLAVETIPTAEEIAAQAREREPITPRWSLGRYPAYEPAAPPSAEQGLIYVYRPERILGSFHRMDIHTESGGTSIQITGVWSGGYFPLYSPPGELTLAVTPWLKTAATPTVTLHVEAGHTYYVQGTVANGWKSPRPGLKVVDAGKGIGEMRHCKRMPTAREAVGETRDLAERGDVWSQLELGELYAAGANYADGESLPRDQLEAYKWFSIAAADKRARDLAARLRDAAGAGMDAGLIAEAERRARVWVEAAGKPRP